MNLARCNIPLLERQKEWVAGQLVRVLWAEAERKLGGRGWGRGGGRRLDRDTKNAGEGDGGWLLFRPGGQGLGMNPSAAVNVPLRGWLCRVIKGCLGDASSPSPGGPLPSALW